MPRVDDDGDGILGDFQASKQIKFLTCAAESGIADRGGFIDVQRSPHVFRAFAYCDVGGAWSIAARKGRRARRGAQADIPNDRVVALADRRRRGARVRAGAKFRHFGRRRCFGLGGSGSAYISRGKQNDQKNE